MKNALHIAERLISLGLSPVPLASPDDPSEQLKPPGKRGKAPFTPGWQKAPAPRSLRDLPDLRPEHNVGIRTGRVIGAKYEVVVVDIDSEDASHWAHENLAPTPVVTKTGRHNAGGWHGAHWFYRRPVTKPGERVGNQGKLRVIWKNPFDDDREVILAIDVKGDEGQVVAPGSRHGTGGTYEELETWTPELLERMPTLDMSKFVAPPKAESAAAEAEDASHGVSIGERRRRFKAYLNSKNVQPTVPGMPPAGAGAYCLTLARVGVWGFSLPVEVAAEEMFQSDWNKRCTDSDGAKYPWTLQDLRHKCKDADKEQASDGPMRKPRGYMLVSDENSNTDVRRVIECGPDVSRCVREVVDALAETADKDRNPICYAQEEKLVFVAETGQVRWLNDASLSVFAARAADFVVISKKKDKETGETDVVPRRVQPPMNIMAKVLALGEWHNIPRLKRIVEVPPVTLGGVIGTKPGYDSASRVYYFGQPLALPDKPTRAAALAARDRLFALVKAIKFASDVDRAKWLAYFLTLATRTAYSRCPLFLITASEQGSGKTETAKLPFSLLYPRSPTPAGTLEDDDKDFDKKVHGLSQLPLVLWDNIADGRTIRNPKVAALVTDPSFTGRELGKHSWLSCDLSGTVLCYTGNKVGLDADLACRAVVIRLNGRPDINPDFNPQNERDVARERPGATKDTYTIVKAWAQAGCPQQPGRPHDRFGDWSRVVQQIVLWLGMPNPVEDNAEMNSDAEHLNAALDGLRRQFPLGQPFTAQDLWARVCRDQHGAREILEHGAEILRRRVPDSSLRCGQVLTFLCDKSAKELGFMLIKTRVSGQNVYKLEPTGKNGAETPPEAPKSSQE